MTDGTAPPRAGEELPLETLGPYLREALGAPGAEVRVSQFPGGHSNLTYLVTVGDRELVLRRPPFGSKVRSAHDMGREARVLGKLAPVWSKAPRPVLMCEDESVIGARFYLMERVRGLILRRALPPGVTFDARAVSTALLDGLIELHALDWQAIGLGDFGHPEGFVERQVTGWTKRYRDAQTDEVADMDRVATYLAEHRPVSPPATIIHNDYKYDNVVLDEHDLTRVVGVLDWEMATIGDPLMDLGTTLCYWVEPGDPDDVKALAFGPTALPGSLTRREVVDRYAEKTGRPVDNIRFYHAFGLFKTAVVVQQIYYRWKTGLTKDARFQAFAVGVKVLGREAARVLADV